jgi:hypothetical protein
MLSLVGIGFKDFFFFPRYEDLAMSTKVFTVCMMLSFTKLNELLLV